MPEKIVLASQSPRRKQLLEWAEIPFDVMVKPTEESYPPELPISARADEIIAAIARHDAEGAGALVRAHLDLSRHRMAEYAAPEGIEIPLVY